MNYSINERLTEKQELKDALKEKFSVALKELAIKELWELADAYQERKEEVEDDIKELFTQFKDLDEQLKKENEDKKKAEKERDKNLAALQKIYDKAVKEVHDEYNKTVPDIEKTYDARNTKLSELRATGYTVSSDMNEVVPQGKTQVTEGVSAYVLTGKLARMIEDDYTLRALRLEDALNDTTYALYSSKSTEKVLEDFAKMTDRILNIQTN